MDPNEQNTTTHANAPDPAVSSEGPPPNPPSWPYMSYGEAILICVALLVLQVTVGALSSIVVIVIGLALGYGPSENPLMMNPAVFMLANVWAVFPLLVWGWWRSGGSLRETFGLKGFHWAAPAAIVPLGIGAALLMSELDNLTRWPFPQMPMFFLEVFEQLFNRPVLGILVVVVMAPLTEEPLFRGVILRGLLRRHGPWAACIVSAFLFGLIHLNPPQVIAASLLGLLLGAVHLRTGSLWPCVWLHAVVNAVPLAAYGLVPWEIRGLTGAPEPGVFQPLWLDVLAIGLFVLGSAFFVMITRRASGERSAAC